jgi:L-rhamnose mutarotase
MIRKAFVMQVHPEQHAEYESRHSPIWPELAATLKEHGAHNYSIYLQAETNQLFAFVEIEDEERWSQVAETEICQKWWAHMSAVMPSNPDNSPVVTPLREVFHLE